jgi:hypothetical protein
MTTNTVEGYYSIFKRGMKGVYQHCAEKHLRDSCHSRRPDCLLWLLRQDLTVFQDLSRLSLKPANHFENRFVAWSQ